MKVAENYAIVNRHRTRSNAGLGAICKARTKLCVLQCKHLYIRKSGRND